MICQEVTQNETGEISLYSTDYPVKPDCRDMEIANERITTYNADSNPRVGDFVIMPDGSYERFAYIWDEGAQTCINGSFALGNGYASMSGSLNPSVPKDKLELTIERRIGNFWFFHHDMWFAHNSVGVRFFCRVYRVI